MVDGDILLYSCELAKFAEGSQFVDYFSYLTQADVAASTDNTGATSRGGNWTLEYNTGTIKASILAANDYQGLLAGVASTVTSIAITSAPVLPAGYTTGDVVTATVVFSNIETVTGTPTLMLNVGGQSVGDVVLFSNAVTLDGQVIDVVTTDTTIQGFDTASGFLATTIDNNWFELNSTVVAGGSTTIEFNFIKHGTYTVGTGGVNVLLRNVAVNSYDLDSGQFQVFGGFSSYTVASNTTLAQTNLANNFVHFENIPPESDGSILGSTTFDRFRVSALYNEINNFQLKVGSSINTPGYYFLDFSGGPTWNTPISYDIPTVTPLTTGNATPTLTGTYPPNVRGSTDKAISLFVTVNNRTYTLGNGLIWKPDGTWSLSIPPADALPPGTYEVLVDTGYGNLINAHTRDNTHNELTITGNTGNNGNVAPVNTIPGVKNASAGIPTLISGLSTTDINNNLASTQLSVTGGIINVDLTGGATISTGGNGTNTLTLIGTEAQINAALVTVNYTANNGISNDTLSIISTDTAGLTDTDNIVINVTNPPTAVNDNATGISGTPVTVNVLGNCTRQ